MVAILPGDRDHGRLAEPRKEPQPHEARRALGSAGDPPHRDGLCLAHRGPQATARVVLPGGDGGVDRADVQVAAVLEGGPTQERVAHDDEGEDDTEDRDDAAEGGHISHG